MKKLGKRGRRVEAPLASSLFGLTASEGRGYDTAMRRCLFLLLLPNLVLTPALCLGHALHDHGEHGTGCAPHFHAHQLPFGCPHEDDSEDDHDADAVLAPDLVAAP